VTTLDAPPVRCKCGALLDVRGKCPALCEPLPLPQPSYEGPTIIGLTHIGRMAAGNKT
jgi:hypothetical protein